MCNKISIIIPTNNRPQLLEQAIQSAYKIFKHIPIIIGNNNANSNINYCIAKKYNCTYLNLCKYESNIPQLYINMLKHVKTPYVLPLDDDDILINSKLHKLALSIMLKHNAFVSFNTIQTNNIEILNKKRFFYTTDLNVIPTFWDGQFQTGAAYYNTHALLTSILEWTTDTNIFDISHDECWALLCIKKQTKYIHLPFNGLQVGRQSNESLNKALALFSSRSYIDDLTKKLYLSADTNNKWKSIQLRELQHICNKKLINNYIFSNPLFKQIEHYISININNMPYKNIKNNILNMLQHVI